MPYSISIPYISNASGYFGMLRDLSWAAWLDSGGSGRYDILVAQPAVTLVTTGKQTMMTDAAGVSYSTLDPFDLIRARLGGQMQAVPGIPFAGGALGYWGYDLGRRYIPMLPYAQDGEHLPEMAVGIYDWAIVLDHQLRNAYLVSHRRFQSTDAMLAELQQRIGTVAKQNTTQEASFGVVGNIRSNLGPQEYRLAFERIKAYLHAGDVYQVNLAQRYEAAMTGDAFEAYRVLRESSPAPYAAFLDWPHAQILCASPERFLEVRDGKVETKPIKGTRPRNKDAIEDIRIAQELQNHPKDRAENLMIVDLLRNDLGKCCTAGSVRTPKLFEVESFAHVHHLVSTVEGTLAKGKHALDLLRECFPGGSVTGAPKQRAMEIIEALEPHRRGIYCGVIGYVGFDGNMDTNIAIRTLVCADQVIRCWAGGGVVADSNCESEYQETLDKAGAMLQVMQQFGGKLE